MICDYCGAAHLKDGICPLCGHSRDEGDGQESLITSQSITYDKHYVYPPVPGPHGRPSPGKENHRESVSELRRIPKSLRFEVLARDGYTCRYCGKRPPEAILEVDHMVSWRDGGKTTFENLVTSCRDCNRGKSSRSVIS